MSVRRVRTARRIPVPLCAAWWALSLALSAGIVQGVTPGDIPIFLSDNHAETFAWITREFPLDEAHVLLLVDAHTDAAAVNHSDALRAALRRVSGLEERAARVSAWRHSGRIQAFNWIEPLMPRPVDRVLWVAGTDLDAATLQQLTRRAGGQLDARMEFESRASGSLAGRWQAADLKGLARWTPPDLPVVVSVDLDFFHGMKPGDALAAFSEIWSFAMRLPRLAGVSFAVSRPWLADEEEARRLLEMALDAVMGLDNRRFTFVQDAPEAVDESLKAAEYRTRQTPVPRFHWAGAGAGIRSRLEQAARRCGDHERSGFDLRVDHAAPSVDEIWRLPSGQPVTVRLHPRTHHAARLAPPARWFLVEPGSPAIDLLPATGLGKSFSASTMGRAVWNRRIYLGESEDGAWTLPATGRDASFGTWRVQAQVETDGDWIWTPPLELRIQHGRGFRRALGGQFRRPYVFGVGLARRGGLTGPDTGWGYDCANFLIAAWRENGAWMPWSDPAGLRKQLVSLGEGLTAADRPALDPRDLEEGLVIDFGPHVAAVWEDRPPCGTLGPEDLAAHHLGGVPEIITMDRLTAGRGPFALRTRKPNTSTRIWFGGDIVMDQREPVLPLADRAPGDLIVANLEGVGVHKARARPGRYRFVFPARHLRKLEESGVRAVSLANNHAYDAGLSGLLECIAEAERTGLRVAGVAGKEPVVLVKNPQIVLLAASLFAQAGGAGITRTLPRDQAALGQQIEELRRGGASVIMMLHGGDEYSPRTNPAQRHWARWCIDRGAALVVFSHPHLVQPLESYRGRPVAFSLGNLVYPPELRGADNGAWLCATFTEDGNITKASLIPLHHE
jgi:hypothetical protein